MRKSDVERYLRRPAARGLSRPARATYRALLVCASTSDGLLPWQLGDQRLRDETGYSRTTVKAARRELVAEGLLLVRETGLGRQRSLYTVVLGPVGVEVALAEERAQAVSQQAVVGGSPPAPPTDPLRVEERPSEGRFSTHPTRAHPSSSGSLSPYPSGQGPGKGEAAPLRGPEEHLAGDCVAAASRCPTAASRGRPCASCRACGTNPRALRKRAAADQATRRVPDLFVDATPPEHRAATNARGLEQARAALAARAAPQAAMTTEPEPPPVPPSAAGGGP